MGGLLPSVSEAIKGYDSVAFEATMTAILENTLTSDGRLLSEERFQRNFKQYR